ncbi:MAG: asparaginase [Limnochordia bacterium]
MRVLVYRDNLVESIHNIHYVVVDRFGRAVDAGGNGKLLTYWRSAAKPLQLLPLVEGGGADKLGLDDSHLAVMASSHNGEEEHVTKVAEILAKLGFGEDMLQCGVHPPWGERAASQLAAKGEEPRPIHNNCSGKHANLLALCRHLDVDPEGYYRPDHPVQVKIMEEIKSLTGLSELLIATDGCGVPVFGLTLDRMAWAYALLASPRELPEAKGKAAKRITEGMMKHPFLVAGTNRFETELMEAAQGKLFAKTGSEGIFCIGIPGEGYGIAMKVEDGHSRAYGPAVLAVLEGLGYLEGELPQWRVPQIRNARGEVIGRMQVEDRDGH